jgi:hypothetical protein
VDFLVVAAAVVVALEAVSSAAGCLPALLGPVVAVDFLAVAEDC